MRPCFDALNLILSQPKKKIESRSKTNKTKQNKTKQKQTKTNDERRNNESGAHLGHPGSFFPATRADCTDPSGLGPVDDAPTSVLDNVIYVFPHICKFNSSPSPACHECDTRDNRGWVAKTDPTTTISYIGASSCVAPAGTLNDDKETMLIVGGGEIKPVLPEPSRYGMGQRSRMLPRSPCRACTLALPGQVTKDTLLAGYGFAGTLSSIEVLESNNNNNWGWRLLEVKMPTWGLSAVALADNVFAIGGHTGTSQGNVCSQQWNFDTRTNT